MASTSTGTTRQDVLAKAWDALENAPADARRGAERLLKSDPKDPDATLLLAMVHRRQGRLGAAQKRLASLISQGSGAPLAWLEWGLILAETGDDAGAVNALRQAVALAPAFTGAWRALGDQLLALGRPAEAIKAYGGAARASTKDARLAGAAAALADGDAEASAKVLSAHVQRFPEDVRAIRLLAEAAMRTGEIAEAEALLSHCLNMAPGFAEARHSLAALLYRQQRFADAAAHMKILLDLRPHQPALRIMRAACLCKIGDHQAAVGLLEQLLAACPTNHAMLLVYGHSLKALGREREAARAYRSCLAIAPGWAPSLYLSLANLKTVRLTESELAGMRQCRAALSGVEGARLSYAIGHALDQRADYAGAFAAFAEGAALRRLSIASDAVAIGPFVQAAMAVFTREFFAARAGSGCPDAGPILIVGLPRAGSTLVEQILASHSQVEGTSELRNIGAMAATLLAGRPMAALPGLIGSLGAETLAALGARYLAETAQFRRLGRPFFIDKMPGNVLHIGLIQLILPHARIIDVRRAPMASGFAAFRQFFQLDQPTADFSYDLRDVGQYYRDYVDLTSHFDAVLPGRVHHLRYEDLVADTETQVRALLDYCKLDFEPDCLRFWKTARAVQTPSAQQVRLPIFREGLDHWRHYEPWLGDLKEALGDVAL